MRNAIDASLFASEYQKTTASLAEIAKYYGVNYNTLKSYAKRHNWQKNKRSEMTLERLYYPEKYSKIPYRVVVFGFAIAFYNVNPKAAYRFTYCSNKETSRVNSYRLLKREDTQFIVEYSNILKNATSSFDDFVEILRPVYKVAFYEAGNVETQIRDDFKIKLEPDKPDSLYTEEAFKRYLADGLEPTPLWYMEHQEPKL